MKTPANEVKKDETNQTQTQETNQTQKQETNQTETNKVPVIESPTALNEIKLAEIQDQLKLLNAKMEQANKEPEAPVKEFISDWKSRQKAGK